MGVTDFDIVDCATDIRLNGVSMVGAAGLSTAERTALETLISGLPMSAALAAPAAEAANARTIAVQLNDHAGAALAVRGIVTVLVSTDATGDAPGDGAATIAVTLGTDGALVGTDENGTVVVSEADGDIDLVITDSADSGATVYVHIIANGKIIGTSAAIAFVDDTP